MQVWTPAMSWSQSFVVLVGSTAENRSSKVSGVTKKVSASSWTYACAVLLQHGT